jgi:hypothetical protein
MYIKNVNDWVVCVDIHNVSIYGHYQYEFKGQNLEDFVPLSVFVDEIRGLTNRNIVGAKKMLDELYFCVSSHR